MNPSIYASLPSSACTLGTAGSYGNDRINQTVYDAASEPTQLKEAVGTSDAATERTLTYSNNGLVTSLLDAESNKTTYVYDGFDRLSQRQYPSSTKGAGTSNSSDYEQLAYDANSNVTSRRLRDANSIGFTFDNLNRVTFKDLPGSEPDVTTAYDNLGRLTSASQSGNSLNFTYDALSRKLTEVGPQGTVTSAYDVAGRRTQLTYPGSGLYVNTDYLVTGEVSAIRENGASSGVGVLATYGYDDLGNRTSVTFGSGVVQSLTYDAVSRLASLASNLSGISNNPSATFAYNPANQITQTVRTGDAFAWTGHSNVNRGYTSNGLNQYSAAGSASLTYDSKGNLTSDGTSSYGYSSENLLTSGPATSLSYDPALRLYQLSGSSSTTRFAYDGPNLIADYDGSNALQHRYVFGPGFDAPIVEYAGSGTSSRAFLTADERGSIIGRSDSSGALGNALSYDEYGAPGSANIGRFQYTGQVWLPEIGLQYSKARIYSPALGRFLQTDPIGSAGGVNLYAYTENDPVNLADPLGTDPPTGTRIEGGGNISMHGCLGNCDSSKNSSSDNRNAEEPRSPRNTASFIVGGLSPVTGIQPDAAPSNTSDAGPAIIVTGVRTALSQSLGLTQVQLDQAISPLNWNFAQVTNLNTLKNPRWKRAASSHSRSAWELSILGNNNFVIKVYIHDTDNGGVNTITLTTPTDSISHYFWFPFYEAGWPVNLENVNSFCRQSHC